MRSVSPGEQAIWLASQKASKPDPYLQRQVYQVRGQVAVDIAQRAVEALIDRHDVLTRAYEWAQGSVQVRTQQAPAFQVVELDDDGAEEVERVAREHVAKEVDLRAGCCRFVAIASRGCVRALVAVIHHVVVDRSAFQVLERDLDFALDALAEGSPPAWGPPPRPYEDFVHRMKTTIKDQSLDSAVAFWQTRLAGARDTPFPLELRVTPEARARSSSSRLVMDASAVWRVRRARPGIAPLAPHLAAAYITAWLYAGTPDVVLNVPVNSRGRDFAGTVGYFVDLLPLRIRAGARTTKAELLDLVSEELFAVGRHRSVPFAAVAQALAERGAAPPPPRVIVEHLGALSTVSVTGDAHEYRRLVPSDPGRGTPRFDVELRIAEHKGADTFSATSIVRHSVLEPGHSPELLDVFQSVLIGLGDGLDDPVCTIALVDDTRQRRLLRARVREHAPTPIDRVVDHMTARAAHSAVGDGAHVVTYSDLGALVERLRDELSDHGVRRGDRVLVALERSAGLVVAQVAVASLGAAFVPVDPAYPAARQQAVWATSAPTLAIAAADGPLTFEEVGPRVLRLDRFGKVEAGEDARARAPLPTTSSEPADVAYVLHTSGSTGEPKSVEVAQGSLANLIDWHIGAYGLSPLDRGLLFSSPGFDASIWELWPLLAAGGTLVVAPEEARQDPRLLRDFICREGVSIAFVPTRMAEHLVRLDWPPGSSLRVLLTGGETLRAFAPPTLPFRFVNHYGPTEVTVLATFGDVGPGDDGYLLPGIGSPIDNVAVVAIDAYGREMPPGVVGEAVVLGAGVAIGYGRDGEGEGAFGPWTLPDGRRVPSFRTGDLVRERPDGSFDFFGRTDRQVKVRGYRVELGEIEAQLIGMDGVLDAAAAVLPLHDQEVLATAVTVDRHFTPRGIKEALASRLPSFMIPSRVVVVDSVPRNAHGKLDVAALEALLVSEPADAQYDGGPEPPNLAAVLNAWRAMFASTEVHADSDFFDLGGHSLLAVALAADMEAQLGRVVPIGLVFDNPSPRRMAQALA